MAKKRRTKKQIAAFKKMQAANRKHRSKASRAAHKKRSARVKPKRVTRGRAAVARRKAQLARARSRPKRTTYGRKAVAKRKEQLRIERMTPAERKAHYLSLLGTGTHKKRRKKKATMAKKKRKGGKRKKARRGHKQTAKQRAASLRNLAKARRARKGRKRGHVKAHARKRKRGRRRAHKLTKLGRRIVRSRARRGAVKRNRKGRFARRGRHVGLIVAEGYSMENPLSGAELATGLFTALIGAIAADTADRYMATRANAPLMPTTLTEMVPLYADLPRLGIGAGLTVLPIVAAHFIKSPNMRAAVQFFGIGAGIRTLTHLAVDVIAKFGSNNVQVQRLYPTEIAVQSQLAAVSKAGASGLPTGVGRLPEGEGLAACCAASGRLLNSMVSPLQPIGRSAEQPPPAYIPPPSYTPPYVPSNERAVPPGPQYNRPAAPPVARVAETPALPTAPAPLTAAIPPAVIASVPTAAGVRGLPKGRFNWGDDNA